MAPIRRDYPRAEAVAERRAVAALLRRAREVVAGLDGP